MCFLRFWKKKKKKDSKSKSSDQGRIVGDLRSYDRALFDILFKQLQTRGFCTYSPAIGPALSAESYEAIKLKLATEFCRLNPKVKSVRFHSWRSDDRKEVGAFVASPYEAKYRQMLKMMSAYMSTSVPRSIDD